MRPTFFLVDDRFHSSHEVMLAGMAAVGLWARAGSWCAGNSPTGFVPAPIAASMGTARERRRLVASGLWDEAPGGYVFAVTEPICFWKIDRQQYRMKIPRWLRARVLERDGYGCVYCGAVSELTMDHYPVPWSLGGSDTEDNLQTLCMPCNRAKGASR